MVAYKSKSKLIAKTMSRIFQKDLLPAKFHRLNFSSVPCSNGQSTLTSQKYLFLWSFNHLTFHSSVAMVTVLIRGILHYIQESFSAKNCFNFKENLHVRHLGILLLFNRLKKISILKKKKIKKLISLVNLYNDIAKAKIDLVFEIIQPVINKQ